MATVKMFFPRGADECGMVCCMCQAVCWYTYKCTRLKAARRAARRVGGHVGGTGLIYCPVCTLRYGDDQPDDHRLNPQRANKCMDDWWARPSELWSHAGLTSEPPLHDALLRNKVRLELVAGASSPFAQAVWADMRDLRDLNSTWATASTSAGQPPAVPAGPPGAGDERETEGDEAETEGNARSLGRRLERTGTEGPRPAPTSRYKGPA